MTENKEIYFLIHTETLWVSSVLETEKVYCIFYRRCFFILLRFYTTWNITLRMFPPNFAFGVVICTTKIDFFEIWLCKWGKSLKKFEKFWKMLKYVKTKKGYISAFFKLCKKIKIQYFYWILVATDGRYTWYINKN